MKLPQFKAENLMQNCITIAKGKLIKNNENKIIPAIIIRSWRAMKCSQDCEVCGSAPEGEQPPMCCKMTCKPDGKTWYQYL